MGKFLNIVNYKNCNIKNITIYSIQYLSYQNTLEDCSI